MHKPHRTKKIKPEREGERDLMRKKCNTWKCWGGRRTWLSEKALKERECVCMKMGCIYFYKKCWNGNKDGKRYGQEERLNDKIILQGDAVCCVVLSWGVKNCVKGTDGNSSFVGVIFYSTFVCCSPSPRFWYLVSTCIGS